MIEPPLPPLAAALLALALALLLFCVGLLMRLIWESGKAHAARRRDRRADKS